MRSARRSRRPTPLRAVRAGSNAGAGKSSSRSTRPAPHGESSRETAMYHLLRQIVKTGSVPEPAPHPHEALRAVEQRLGELILKHFGRSLAIRHVDAGPCNGCELEIHAMNGPHYNLERIAIKFVASPRHADMLLVTGPVPPNMEVA